jgi:hypothetical protein
VLVRLSKAGKNLGIMDAFPLPLYSDKGQVNKDAKLGQKPKNQANELLNDKEKAKLEYFIVKPSGKGCLSR